MTATDVGRNGTVAPGSSAGFGFTGTSTGGSTEPDAFALGGAACSVG